MKFNKVNRTLSVTLAVFLFLGTITVPNGIYENSYFNSYAYEENLEHLAYGNSKLGVEIGKAIDTKKKIIYVHSSIPNAGDTEINSEINKIYATKKDIYFGWIAKNTITIKSGADVVIENIDFSKRRDSDEGAYVVIEEGAKVKFINVTFSNTVVNNGNATFENVTFKTGVINNNGSAVYTGNTQDPRNIGTPKPTFVELNLSLNNEYGFERVVGREETDEVKFELIGTNKDSANIKAEILPEGSGLSASITGNRVQITGAPLSNSRKINNGEYKLVVTAESTKEDNSSDIVSKELPITIEDTIIVKLEGKIQAYTVGTEGSSGVSVVSSATGGGGGSVSTADSDKVKLMVKEGEGEFVEFDKYQKSSNKNLSAKVISTKITPEGSGLEANYIAFGTVQLSGAPKKPGKYYLCATVQNGSRIANTNEVEIRVYDPNVSFADRVKELDRDLKYWEMEPYVIPNTGNAIIPNNIKKIYGSNEVGLYGRIGNISTFATQTITIPSGTDVSLVNMKVNSDTKIIVEKGGKLTLDGSVAFGPIKVNGGTLKLLRSSLKDDGTVDQKGSSITNTITLNDGSVLEDSEIQSYADFLTDGNVKAPEAPNVVVVNGNVEFKGKVDIKSAVGNGTKKGQTGLQVNDGTLKLDKGSELKVNGGGKEDYIFSPNGGDAINLNNGKIVGEGTLIAEGGYGHQASGKGGNAVSGSGSIEVNNLGLKGGDGGSKWDANVYGYGVGGDVATKGVKVKFKKSQFVSGKGSKEGSKEVELVDTPNNQNQNNQGTNLGSKPSSGSNSNTTHSGSIVWKPTNVGGSNRSNPTYKADNELKVERIKGEDRIGTSIEVSKKYFKNSDVVILADASNYADALAASVLAKNLNAPILLTNANYLDGRTIVEIKRLNVNSIVLVGGENAISKKVSDELGKIVNNVDRISGSDRYETSKKIAEKIKSISGKIDNFVLASGENYPDAISVSAYASKNNYPILLTKKNSIPESIKELVKSEKTSGVYIIGGTASISKSVENNLNNVKARISGSDRYETSRLIADMFKSNSKSVFITSGEVFADTLVIGSVAARENKPILLTASKSYNEIEKYINEEKIEKISIVGGEKSLPKWNKEK